MRASEYFFVAQKICNCQGESCSEEADYQQRKMLISNESRLETFSGPPVSHLPFVTERIF